MPSVFTCNVTSRSLTGGVALWSFSTRLSLFGDHDWLVVWNIFIFHFIYGIIPTPLTFIFFRGVGSTTRSCFGKSSSSQQRFTQLSRWRSRFNGQQPDLTTVLRPYMVRAPGDRAPADEASTKSDTCDTRNVYKSRVFFRKTI